ncbi:MAG: type II secretion system F family protein [Planctomycetota bacterium]
MFFILPLLLISTLMSILSLAAVSSIYGVGLILLAHGIRNVRLETSRSSLREFLKYVAIDQFLSAATTIGCIAFLLHDGGQIWLQHSQQSDASIVVVMATIMGLLLLCFVGLGVLLVMMNPDLRTRVPVPQQMRWIPWTNVMTVVGLALNLMTFGCLLVAVAPLLWHIGKIDRGARQSSLIWTLAIAVRQGLPIGKEVEVLADGMWGRHRMRLQLLSENLDAGLSLSAALERQPGLIPSSAIMLIRMGEETNTLQPALDNAAMSYGRSYDREVDLISAQQTLTLLLIPLAVMPQIVGFLCYYIMPKFKKIFMDFGMELPSVTTGFIRVSDVVVSVGPLFLVFGCFGAIVVVITMSVRGWDNDLPLLGYLMPGTNGPSILRGLALLIRQQRPLAPGIQAMSTSHPRRSARRKLEVIYGQLLGGGDLAYSLADQRLIRHGDAALLKTAERVQNMPWVLEQLADSMEHKFWHRVRLWLEIGYPIGIILVGGLVLFVILAFYMPLVSLLNSLS